MLNPLSIIENSGVRAGIVLMAAFALFCLPGCKPEAPAAPTRNIGQLLGKNEAAVVELLGTPSFKNEYAIKEMVGSFRDRIFETYPKDDPEHADGLIREWTWYLPEHNATVWLHRVNDEWVVLDTLDFSYKGDK